MLQSPAVSRAGPDVVLVVLDTARADHFGPFGGRSRTPAFDDLAERGEAVRAWSTSPWTVPSHASMFSGQLPFEHGVTGAAAITPDRRLASLRPAIEARTDRWLPERFRRAGYRTVAISANVWITPTMGFDLGFDRFEPVGMASVTPRGADPDHRWRMRDLVPDPVRRRAKQTVRYVRDARRGRDFGASQALRRVRSTLDESGSEPLFLFVNVMEAHAPYLPPPAFNPLEGRERLRGPGLNHRYLGDEFVAAYNLGVSGVEVPAHDLELLRALYSGEVAYADRFLAGLLEALGERLDRTVVAVTADHGENLGEDHRLGHVLAVDERLLSVPLAVRGPDAGGLAGLGRAPSLQDVPWLLAEAAGLREHPYARSGGEVALAQYESGWNHLRRAAQVERRHRLTGEQRAALRSSIVAATDGATLLVRSSGGVGGGDRVTGPPEAVQALDRALNRQATGPEDVSGYTPIEEAEVEERLRELGYL